MSELRTFRVRVTFRKAGRLAMLSHLELARALERGVRRAEVPFAVTQGFSPHMRIAFGAALPVGIGGEQEIFDLLLTAYVAPAKLLSAFQEAFPEDLMVLSCTYIEPKAEAASAALPFCTYKVELSRMPGEWKVPETVTVVRKKKEKELEVADFLCGDMIVDGTCVTFTLESKQSGSLRPDVLIAACLRESCAACGDAELPQVLRFTRIRQSESMVR